MSLDVDDNEMDGTEEGSQSQPRGPVKSAERTLRILEFLALSKTRATFQSIHKGLNIPKSSLHGILRTLVQSGWVEVDESGTRFRVGSRSLMVGTAYLTSDATLALVSDHLDNLLVSTVESVHFARLDGDAMVYLTNRKSPQDLLTSARVGRRAPLHASALGKAVLATFEERELDAVLQGPLERLTPKTITDSDILRKEIAETRQRGYAIENEEYALGVFAIAAALPSEYGVRDAIAVSMPISRNVGNREAEIAALLFQEIQLILPRVRG